MAAAANETITPQQMDQIMEAGIVAQREGISDRARAATEPWLGFRKTTPSGTPFLDKPWVFGKKRGWSLPARGFFPRTIRSTGLPLAAGSIAYLLSDWLTDQARGGGSSEALSKAQRILGY
jgi:hypothetical protein